MTVRRATPSDSNTAEARASILPPRRGVRLHVRDYGSAWWKIAGPEQRTLSIALPGVNDDALDALAVEQKDALLPALFGRFLHRRRREPQRGIRDEQRSARPFGRDDDVGSHPRLEPFVVVLDRQDTL